jgi:hypothetical protein
MYPVWFIVFMDNYEIMKSIDEPNSLTVQYSTYCTEPPVDGFRNTYILYGVEGSSMLM